MLSFLTDGSRRHPGVINVAGNPVLKKRPRPRTVSWFVTELLLLRRQAPENWSLRPVCLLPAFGRYAGTEWAAIPGGFPVLSFSDFQGPPWTGTDRENSCSQWKDVQFWPEHYRNEYSTPLWFLSPYFAGESAFSIAKNLANLIQENASVALDQTEFRDELWGGLVDPICIDEKSSTVVFRGGIEITT